MNNKHIRYLLGFLLLAFIILSFYISKIMLFAVSVLFITAGMYEYNNMFKLKNIHPHIILCDIIGILFSYIFVCENDFAEQNFITPILVFGIISSFILTVIKNRKPYILTSLSTIGGFLFVFCGLYIIKLTYYFEQMYSFYLILVYFTAVLTGDFAASKIGPHFKNKLLAPEISPNKTIAGAIANAVFSSLSCLLLVFFLKFTIIECITTGIIISMFSQFGDLTVSTFKRDLGLKHSGGLFLNYGGILDRMDAFIFSAPAAYYYLFIITII